MFKKTYLHDRNESCHYSTTNNLKGGQIYGNQTVLNLITEKYPNQNIQKKTAGYLNGIVSEEARHHIIPNSVLRAFIDKIITRDKELFKKILDAVEKSFIHYHKTMKEGMLRISSTFKRRGCTCLVKPH